MNKTLRRGLIGLGICGLLAGGGYTAGRLPPNIEASMTREKDGISYVVKNRGLGWKLRSGEDYFSGDTLFDLAELTGDVVNFQDVETIRRDIQDLCIIRPPEFWVDEAVNGKKDGYQFIPTEGEYTPEIRGFAPYEEVKDVSNRNNNNSLHLLINSEGKREIHPEDEYLLEVRTRYIGFSGKEEWVERKFKLVPGATESVEVKN